MIKNNEINLNTQQIYAFSEFLQTITECPISSDSMTDPSTTPCGHTFDYKDICQSLEYSNKCPMDRQVITSEELIPNLFVKALLENKIELEEMECTNLELSQKVINLKLDDRNQSITRLFEIIKCPISQEIIKSPVMGPCGHTFDINSIQEDTFCPLDNIQLNKKTLLPT